MEKQIVLISRIILQWPGLELNVGLHVETKQPGPSSAASWSMHLQKGGIWSRALLAPRHFDSGSGCPSWHLTSLHQIPIHDLFLSSHFLLNLVNSVRTKTHYIFLNYCVAKSLLSCNFISVASWPTNLGVWFEIVFDVNQYMIVLTGF